MDQRFDSPAQLVHVDVSLGKTLDPKIGPVALPTFWPWCATPEWKLGLIQGREKIYNIQ